MAEINVSIDPEQVNKAVAEAIIQSTIGEELERIISREVEKLSRSYNNPIEGVVQRQVELAITTTIHDNYAVKIRELVAEKVTEKFTDDLFEKLWRSFEGRY